MKAFWKPKKGKEKKPVKNKKAKTAPKSALYTSPRRYPSLFACAAFSTIAYFVPLVWLAPVASTFLLIGPLAFIAGYIIYLELCKLFDIWPFEPKSGFSFLNMFNPIQYIITPQDIVTATIAYITIINEGFKNAWKRLTDWGKTVDRKAAQSTKDFERRYIQSHAPATRKFDRQLIENPSTAAHYQLARNMRETRDQFEPILKSARPPKKHHR